MIISYRIFVCLLHWSVKLFSETIWGGEEKDKGPCCPILELGHGH